MIKSVLIYLAISNLILISCLDDKRENEKSHNPPTLRKICKLPIELYETSGIIFHNGLLWSFNDSGNQPILYGMDTSDCSIKHRLTLEGISNVDWEAISQDSEHIYIGDIGNNGKSRSEFYIYKIPKDSISKTSYQNFSAYSTIEFTFDERDEDLLKAFDAEALLVSNDSIIIYTKDWHDERTRALYIPNKPGRSIVKIFGSFDINCLVTSVIQNDKDEIIFLGYSDYVPFLTILESDILLNEVTESKRFDLNSYQGMQGEAITWSKGQYFLSCEGSIIEQGLYELRFN